MIIFMEFCSKTQLVVSQFISSMNVQSVGVVASQMTSKNISIQSTLQNLKMLSDCFFLIFDRTKQKTGNCFTEVTQDSFWFFFSLLKVSLGFTFNDNLEREHYHSQILTFYKTLVENKNDFYCLILQFILTHEFSNYKVSEQSLFEEILKMDKFEEFYSVCGAYIGNDVQSLFICFNQLIEGSSLF